MFRGVLARRIGARTMLLVAAAACTHPPLRSTVDPTGSPCIVIPPARHDSATAPRESLIVGIDLREPSEPWAGRVSNPIDALTAETLIRVDCSGVMIPALAEHWETDAGSRRWTFMLREHAAWPDGDAAPARAVIAAWRARPSLDAELRAIVDSARAVDARTIVVHLPDGDPRVLAVPELAIALASAASDSSIGPGAYRVSWTADEPIASPHAERRPRVLVRRNAVAGDGRDMVDAGAEVLFTDDPATVAYARSFDDFTIHPVVGRWLYVLIVRRPRVERARDSVSSTGLEELRYSLAHETVAVPARPAMSWWGSSAVCAPPATRTGPTSGDTPPARIAYRGDDPVGRAIAERLVALAARPDDRLIPSMLGGERSDRVFPVTAALSPDEFARALRDGSAAAFVVAVPASPLTPCAAMRALDARSPWLADDGARSAQITPLIETGLWIIGKPGGVAVTLDWGASPRLLVGPAELRSERR